MADEMPVQNAIAPEVTAPPAKKGPKKPNLSLMVPLTVTHMPEENNVGSYQNAQAVAADPKVDRSPSSDAKITPRGSLRCSLRSPSRPAAVGPGRRKVRGTAQTPGRPSRVTRARAQ